MLGAAAWAKSPARLPTRMDYRKAILPTYGAREPRYAAIASMSPTSSFSTT